MNYRALVKDMFYRTGTVGILDFLLYRFNRFRHRKRNAAFRAGNPSLIIPPDYYLYETFRLDYEQFFRNGHDAAEEVLSWTKRYLSVPPARILDWGCGVSRVVTHILQKTGPKTAIYACDMNREMIEFGRRHYKDIIYDLALYFPPTSYQDAGFDLIYAFSVFTHIEAVLQVDWIREIHRILRDGGVFLFTTHGKFFLSGLLDRERELYNRKGAFTKTYKRAGHRMMTTYNDEKTFRDSLEPWFEVLEFHDGTGDLTKAGGQDLWIIRKVNTIR